MNHAARARMINALIDQYVETETMVILVSRSVHPELIALQDETGLTETNMINAVLALGIEAARAP